MYRNPAFLLLLTLAACKPPASDDMADRGAVQDARAMPSAPIASPDVTGAVWAQTATPDKILYGKPGQPALVALACNTAVKKIELTRYAIADAETSALMPLIGNGHIARLPVEAEWNGTVWLWQGSYAPGLPDLDVLTGPREVELTIPGAGTVLLNPSQRPGLLIDQCRARFAPPPQPDQ